MDIYGVTQGFITQLSESRATDVEGVGTKRREAGNVYMWIKNGEGSAALTAGMPACHKSGSGANYTVLKPATNYLARYAGRIKSTSIAAGEYGWIQIEGEAVGLVYGTATDHAITAGMTLKPVNAKVYMLYATAADATPTYGQGYEVVEVGYTTATTDGAECTVSIFGQMRGGI